MEQALSNLILVILAAAAVAVLLLLVRVLRAARGAQVKVQVLSRGDHEEEAEAAPMQ